VRSVHQQSVNRHGIRCHRVARPSDSREAVASNFEHIPLAGSIETFHNRGSAAVPAAFVRARCPRSREPKRCAGLREPYQWNLPENAKNVRVVVHVSFYKHLKVFSVMVFLKLFASIILISDQDYSGAARRREPHPKGMISPCCLKSSGLSGESEHERSYHRPC
jgi:hypothetical protein